MHKKIRIVLIEDDIDDVELLQDSLSSNNVNCDLYLIPDGQEAISFLQNQTFEPSPDVIIMDFNLPKIHGRELLAEYTTSTYANVPLIVFTTSSANEDRNLALKNGANRFLIKPNNYHEMKEIISVIKEVTGTR